jgi:hypothetical protein
MEALMRGLLVMALLAATVPAEAGMWTAACQDQQVQYQQITGAEGYLHVSHGDGTYRTVKLKQSFLDSKMVCGSVPAKVRANDIATVCADSDGQTIRILRGADLAKGVKPEKAPLFCQAVVNVH